MTNETQSGNDNSNSVPFGLKLFVYAMGVMIIVMLIALVVKVMSKPVDQAPTAALDVPVALNNEGVPEVLLETLGDGRIGDISIDRDMLAVVVESEFGDKVIVFDLKKNQVVATLNFQNRSDLPAQK